MSESSMDACGWEDETNQSSSTLGLCVSDADCNRGLCEGDGFCSCYLPAYGPYCANPVNCLPEFADLLHIHRILFSLLFLAVVVFSVGRLILVSYYRGSWKFWSNWLLKDTVVVACLLAALIRFLEIGIDPYDLKHTFGAGPAWEASISTIPIALMITVYLQITLLWYRVYRVAHGNTRPAKKCKIFIWVTIAWSFPARVILAAIGAAGGQAILLASLADVVILVVIIPAMIFTTVIGVSTLRYLRRSPLAAIFRRSVLQIAFGLATIDLTIIAIIVCLGVYTLLADPSDPNTWLRWTFVWRGLEVLVLVCELFVVCFARERPTNSISNSPTASEEKRWSQVTAQSSSSSSVSLTRLSSTSLSSATKQTTEVSEDYEDEDEDYASTHSAISSSLVSSSSVASA